MLPLSFPFPGLLRCARVAYQAFLHTKIPRKCQLQLVFEMVDNYRLAFKINTSETWYIFSTVLDRFKPLDPNPKQTTTSTPFYYSIEKELRGMCFSLRGYDIIEVIDQKYNTKCKNTSFPNVSKRHSQYIYEHEYTITC